MINNTIDFNTTFYKHPIMIQDERVAEIVKQMYPNLLFEKWRDYNKEDKIMYRRYPKTPNEHPVLHIVRDIEETMLLNDVVRFSDNICTYKDKDNDGKEYNVKVKIANREITDINSSRAVNKGYAKSVLTPIVEGTDHERRHATRSDIEEYNNNLINLEEERIKMKNDRNVTVDRYINAEAYDQTLQEYADTHMTEDNLIIMTDVIYYIPDRDLYTIFARSRDGVVSIGTLHIPKHEDFERHAITFQSTMGEEIEGFVEVKPNTDTSPESKNIEFRRSRFIMKTNGNDHYYQSGLRFMELNSNDAMIIPQPSNQNYNFVLKIVAIRKIDTNATNYVSFKIYKLTNPSIQDFYNKQYVDEFNKHEFIRIQYEALRNKQIAEDEQHWQHTLSVSLGELQRYTKMVPNPYYVKTLTDRIKSLLVSQDHDEVKEVKKINNQYIIYRSTEGFFRSPMYNRIQLDNDCTKVSAQLVNRICVKITIAPKVDRTLINTLINYINNEDKNLSIDEIIALLVHCLSEVYNAESKLTIVNQIASTKEINALKNSEYKILPRGFIDALFKQQLWQYIKFKVKTSVGMGVDMSNNQNQILDF